MIYKQQNNHFYNKILDSSDEYYDILLTSTNKILFDYGDHLVSNRISYKRKIMNMLLYRIIFSLKNYFLKKRINERIIISNAFVRLSISNSLALYPPWVYSVKKNSISSWRITGIIQKINKEIRKKSIKVLLSSDFKKLIFDFESELEKLFSKNNISALIVPYDIIFYENLAIKVAQKMGIPSFVYLHGLPGVYNNVDNNKADYLVVWGMGIKNEYISRGVDSSKILTIKHPVYSEYKVTYLESNLSDVLVLSKAISGTPSSSTELILPNRSVILYYLELLKDNLIKLGINSATLRVHPSEDREFYLRNLPDNFFRISKLSKEEDLSNASLVIGSTSTMVLDTIKAGKNYILFDPVFDGLTLEGVPLVEPFTGNSFIKLSNSYDEIFHNIMNPGNNINFEKLNDFLKIDSADEEKFLNILNGTYNDVTS